MKLEELHGQFSEPHLATSIPKQVTMCTLCTCIRGSWYRCMHFNMLLGLLKSSSGWNCFSIRWRMLFRNSWHGLLEHVKPCMNYICLLHMNCIPLYIYIYIICTMIHDKSTPALVSCLGSSEAMKVAPSWQPHHGQKPQTHWKWLVLSPSTI